MSKLIDKDSVLSIIFESTHMMVAYLDTDLRFVRVNRAYADVDGKPPEAFVGQKHFDLYPNEENEAIFRRVIETGEPHFSYAKSFEYEYNPERGVTHWDWSLVPSRDEQGQVTGAVLQLIDVTERIRAEEHLMIEQDFGNAVLESTKALVMVLDQDGHITRFNRACEQVTGFTADEISNKCFWDCLAPGPATGAIRKSFETLGSEPVADLLGDRLVNRDGGEILVDWNTSILKDDDGRALHVVAVGVDVTDRQRTLERLERSEETMRSAQAVAHIGTWDWDISSNRLDWSDEIFSIFGENRDSFGATYDHFLQRVHEDDRSDVEAAVAKCLGDQRETYSVDHRIVRRDGGIRFVRETGRVYFNETGKAVRMIGIVQDVTSARDAENALKQAHTINAEILAGVPAGISLYRESGECLVANDAIAKAIGATREQVLAQNFHHISSWKQVGLYQLAQQALASGEKRRQEIHVVSTFGKETDLDCSFVPIEIGSDRFLLLMLDDISARKQSERDLVIAQTAIETSIDPIVFGDLEGKISWCNQAFLDLCGLTSEDVVGRQAEELWDYNGGAEEMLNAMQQTGSWIGDGIVRAKYEGKREVRLATKMIEMDGNPLCLMASFVDMTEDNRVRKALKENSELLEKAEEIASVGCWNWDIVTNEMVWTDEVYRMLGYKPQSFPTDFGTFSELIHPEDREVALAALMAAVENPEVKYDIEHRIVRRDGTAIVVREKGEVHRDASGKPLYVVGIAQDITKQKSTEQALRASESRLNSFFNQSLDGFFFMMLDQPVEWNADADKEQLLDYVFSHQRMSEINSAMLDQYGGEREQFIGKTPADLFEHDIEYGRQLWRRLFDDGRLEVQTEEKKFDGTLMWVEGEYVCLYDDQGRITGHFGVQRDVTEQKNMEDDIRVSENRLKEAQRIAKVGSWELDLQTNSLFWTDEIYSLFEIDKDNFGASYDAFLAAIHPEDREQVNAAYTQSLEDMEPYGITHRLLMADGRIKWVEERCWTTFDDDKKPLVSRGTVQDITSRKEQEQELERYREKLEELVAERTRDLVAAQNELVRKERLATLGQLTATVSHELRNPLGAMRPSLYLVQRASDPDNQKLQQAIERLDRNINRCDHIIDELLDFTRITVLEKNDVLIDEWVRQLLDEQAVPAGINIVQDLKLNAVSAAVDTNRLRRAMINVIDNGVHAMQGKAGTAAPAGELTVFTRDLGDRIEIGVRDTGTGITEDVLPHVFEPLYSTKGFGVGLGMPTVKQIVDQHGGEIDIETSPDAGTTVKFLLPKNTSIRTGNNFGGILDS